MMAVDPAVTIELKRLIGGLASATDVQADEEADRLIADLALSHPMTLRAALCLVSDNRPGIGNFRLMRAIAQRLVDKLGAPWPQSNTG